LPADLVTRVLRPASGDVYWLNDVDETHLGSRSPSFTRYLVAHCRWDDQMERDVRSGKRPLADMKDMWACRRRVTAKRCRRRAGGCAQGAIGRR
jgi:hypothetical protein